MPQPQKKQPRQEYSAESEEDPTMTTIEVGLLESINNKLAILEILHQDINDLKSSLEFSQSQIESLQKENNEMHTKISELTKTINSLKTENKLLKEAILDIQCRMRDNLFFSGIPEQTQDNPEQAIKDFMHSTLKLPKETVNNITFHRVHRLGSNNKNLDTKHPRPIVAEFVET
ncbi:M-phase phosphoprotein 9 [Labeo rohita]|uniref:M-phase phosphoprotein 9 n=1 Tax=Labeo rohita TaxID=84645 RepID=A0ABQ8M3F1_LABRO|nr:M-phase phosphoprotein 9 [Labeo rohita]